MSEEFLLGLRFQLTDPQGHSHAALRARAAGLLCAHSAQSEANHHQGQLTARGRPLWLYEQTFIAKRDVCIKKAWNLYVQCKKELGRATHTVTSQIKSTVNTRRSTREALPCRSPLPEFVFWDALPAQPQQGPLARILSASGKLLDFPTIVPTVQYTTLFWHLIKKRLLFKVFFSIDHRK